MLYFALAALGAVIFVNGWTDAPNAVATAVGSGAFTPRRAVALAALFNFVGALSVLVIGGGVAKSISLSADLGVGREALASLAAGMCAVVVWAVVAWAFGIPTSESHALLAALDGAGVAVRGRASVGLESWRRVGIGLVLSTLPAFFLAVIVYLFLGRCLRGRENSLTRPVLSLIQRLGAMSGALMHGVQDGQKFMGIIILAVSLNDGGMPADAAIPVPAVISCALLMSAGTALGGGRIIKKVAFDMVKLDHMRGVAADIASTVCLVGCTAAALPVSTTHARVCAVMGAGSAGKDGKLGLRDARDVVLAWILTFPAAFLLGLIFAEIILWVDI